MLQAVWQSPISAGNTSAVNAPIVVTLMGGLCASPFFNFYQRRARGDVQVLTLGSLGT